MKMCEKKEDQSNKNSSNFRSSNQYLSVIICSFMATMYGQTIGWSSAAIPQLEKGDPSLPSGENGINSFYSGWVGGSFCLGALVSAPVHGLLADAKGRKFAAYCIGICFLIHWCLISFGGSMPLLLVGRAFGGAAGAGSITISSIYSNEVSESRIRGTLGSFLALFYVLGIFNAFVVGAYASFYTTTYIYLASCIMFLPAWWKMPETPSYLLLCGQEKKALKSLMWLRKCNESEASILLSELKVQQAGAAKTATIREFFNHPASRKGICLASLLSSIQTFSGIFAVHSYASTIFRRAGGILDPFTSTIIYGASMSIGAIMPIFLVDRSGRKVLLAWSCSLLSVSMVILCLYFWGVSSGYLVSKYKPGSDRSTIDVIISLLPVVTLSWSVFVYYIGLGSVTYISVAELFLDEMRGVAGAIVAAVVWLTSFILLQFFGPAVELLGDHFVFLFFSAVCFSGTVFTIMLLPETKNKSPQEIAERLRKK